MKKYIWLLIILTFSQDGCPSGSGSRPRPQPQPVPIPAHIEVRGTQKFQAQTERALALLRNRHDHAWQKVRKYIYIVEQGQHSAIFAYERPPRFEVNNITAFHSVTWYAGVIAHEARHAELYHGYVGFPVPPSVWSGQQAERICIEFQIQVLQQIGAPYHEIQFLRKIDGTHCDLDGDGDCDWADYERRQW